MNRRWARVAGPGAAVPAALLALAALCGFLTPARADAPASTGLKGKVVVIVVDRVGIAEFPGGDTPFCSSLADRWSTGLMATRTASSRRSPLSESGAEYVCLGAGVQSDGGVWAGLSCDGGEPFRVFTDALPAGGMFTSLGGERPPTDGVVCFGWAEVARNMTALERGENAGLLGDLLAGTGKKAAVVGNCDGVSGPLRLAPLICCDSAGLVPMGRVAGWRPFDTTSKASMERLAAAGGEYLDRSDLLVVDTGVTGRLDRDADVSSERYLEGRRRIALGEVDGLVEALAASLDLNESLLLVVSPCASTSAREKGDFLTPFIAAGKGFGDGLLRSSSTRRAGLVNNSDFLPTVLQFFGITTPSEVTGSPMETVPAPDQVRFLKELDAQFRVTRWVRWYVVLPYLVLAAILFVLWTLSLERVSCFLRRPGLTARLARLTGPASLVLSAAPVSFLLVSAFRFNGVALPVALCGTFSLLVGICAWMLPRWRPGADPFVAVCLLTVAVIAVDTLMGARLFVLPLLGDSALEATRFFGFSNTVAGLLIAAFVWAAAGLGGRKLQEPGRARRLLLAGIAALAIVTGFGLLGANAGGLVVALATGLVFYFGASGARFTMWLDLAIAGIVAVATGMMVVADVLLVRTHTARAATGGIGRLAALLSQRLSIQLGQTTSVLPLAIVLLMAVVVLVVLMRRPGGFFQDLWEKECSRTSAFFAVLVGGLVAMVFEDTGLAMLATMFLVSVLAVVYYQSTTRPRRSLPASPA